MSPNSLRKILTFGFTRWEWALALIVIGVHLAVYSYAGSPLPYYDQWLMEFNDTLLFISTSNGFSALLLRHNGHLLVTTKILTILGYFLNGYWEVSFLVLCSAGVRALTAAWTFQLISPSSRLQTKVLLWLLCLVVFAAPYSGFNFLNGMQVCFYLADLALLWSLRVTTHWAGPVASGLALIGGTLFGVASLASAVAIPACTLAAALFQRRARPGFWPAWTISATLTLGFILTGRHEGALSAIFSPSHLQVMLSFWLQMISWPAHLAAVGVVVLMLSAIAVGIALKCERSRTSANAIILGLGGYAVLNAALIAIGREPAQWHMRHWDTIAFLPLATLALGLHLADLNIFKRPVLLLTGGIALGFVLCTGNLIRTVSWPYMATAHNHRSAALEHYRTLLLEQDLHTESDRINMLLEARDYSFFDDPIGRYSLHPVVLENLLIFHRRPLTMLSPEIIPTQSPSHFSKLAGKIVSSGWLLGLLGIVLGITAVRRESGRAAAISADST